MISGNINGRMTVLPTFRDPEGSCVTLDNRVLRFIRPVSAERIRALVESTFIQSLIAEGVLPATHILSATEVSALPVRISDLFGAKAGDGLVLEHERIEFVSFPHEWCPEMLYAAGELTLAVQLRALDAGFSLKDATPGNILFRGSKPVFVDIPSFVPRPLGTPVWIAYAQFVRTFLLPLILSKQRGIPPHEVFFRQRDGMEPEEVYAQLPVLSRLGSVSLQYVSLPTWLGRTQAVKETPQAAKTYDEERALMILRMLVKGLQNAMRKTCPPIHRKSSWSNYMVTSTYERETFAAKEKFVQAALEDLAPATVLDVGCNTGHFSQVAARLGASVIAIDYDPVVVGRLYGRARAQKVSILPLIVNLARPSPGLGWRNFEIASFLDRVRGRIDAALLLAVIHHLTVTDGIPLSDVFRLMSELASKGIVAEFVPPSDPMFVQIVRNKEYLIPALQREHFEDAFTPWFTLVRCEPLVQSGRILYFLRKKKHTVGAPLGAPVKTACAI